MLEEIELCVYEKFIQKMVVEINGVEKIFREDLDKLELTPHEKNFIMYIINKKKIKIIDKKITQEDRSPFVRDNNYGDIKGNDLQELDEPVMSKIEISPSKEIAYEDYRELDEYLEKRFIPTYVLLKKRKNSKGENEYFPSIRLHHITALKLSEIEFKHVMDYLKEKNIRVGGRGATLDGEFENYDYVTTYKESALPLSVSSSVTLQKISLYKQNNDSKLREEIITDNMRLVPYVAYRYAIATSINQHELESYGYEGLILALEKYDISIGCAFSTYAVACIRGYVLGGIQEILQGKKDNFYYDYVNAKIAVEKENGVTLAEEPELVEDVIDLLIATGKIKGNSDSQENARRKITSLAIGNISFDDEESTKELTETDLLTETYDYDTTILRKSSKEMIYKMLNTLTEKEAEVIKLRFGFYDGKTRTYEEIGKMYGVTKERIRQIEIKAIHKLRHPARAKHLQDYYYIESENIEEGISPKIK